MSRRPQNFSASQVMQLILEGEKQKESDESSGEDDECIQHQDDSRAQNDKDDNDDEHHQSCEDQTTNKFLDGLDSNNIQYEVTVPEDNLINMTLQDIPVDVARPSEIRDILDEMVTEIETKGK